MARRPAIPKRRCLNYEIHGNLEMQLSIEQEVLRYDRRGIGRLHPYVGKNFCLDAADFVLNTSGPILIGTGFYIAHARKPETDGPPGALSLARGLERMGRKVAFVTDEVCAPMMRKVAEGRTVYVILMGDGDQVRQAAHAILDEVKPGLLIAIERCGPDADGKFLQFSGTDITQFTGRMEYLFDRGIPSIGIVDGGNEIGIGAVADVVRGLSGLPDRPCVVRTDKTVLGSVANWGAYGILTALSQRTGEKLLPTVPEEIELRAAVVAAGAIDGDSGESIGAIDGYPSELNSLVVERLHRMI
jgi:hypothetical protein